MRPLILDFGLGADGRRAARILPSFRSEDVEALGGRSDGVVGFKRCSRSPGIEFRGNGLRRSIPTDGKSSLGPPPPFEGGRRGNIARFRLEIVSNNFDDKKVSADAETFDVAPQHLFWRPCEPAYSGEAVGIEQKTAGSDQQHYRCNRVKAEYRHSEHGNHRVGSMEFELCYTDRHER